VKKKWKDLTWLRMALSQLLDLKSKSVWEVIEEGDGKDSMNFARR
jgi:hypothetical protein